MPLRLAAHLLLFAATILAQAQTAKHPNHPPKPNLNVSVALLSDPHFDPFRHPSKLPRLATAPVAAWPAILAEPPAPDDAKAFAALQLACPQRGLDADNNLMQSAFAAAARQIAKANPAFVLLAGDLLVHRFDCAYTHLLKDTGPADIGLPAFAAKTAGYVALQLHARFPHTPVFTALGNNDSGCGDYHQDEHDPFFAATADAIAQGWTNIDPTATQQALADYTERGAYNLPLPLQKSRLIVLNDTFLSVNYKNCKGGSDPAPAEHLLAWLNEQLTAAETHGEQVWLLLHIPPGVNVYNTTISARNVCKNEDPVMFLNTEALAGILTRHAPTIRVVIAGHTHLDEMRVYESEINNSPETKNSKPLTNTRIAIKNIPSLSPISGNPPAFLTASVDPRTATLLDYQLHSASASTGPNIQWPTAYDFQQAYHQPAFTPETVAAITEHLASTDPADEAPIKTYQDHLATGLKRLALQVVWPQYLCSLTQNTPHGYASCSCPAPVKP